MSVTSVVEFIASNDFGEKPVTGVVTFKFKGCEQSEINSHGGTWDVRMTSAVETLEFPWDEWTWNGGGTICEINTHEIASCTFTDNLGATAAADCSTDDLFSVDLDVTTGRKLSINKPTDFSDFDTKQGVYTFTLRGYNSAVPDMYKDDTITLTLKADCSEQFVFD